MQIDQDDLSVSGSGRPWPKISQAQSRLTTELSSEAKPSVNRLGDAQISAQQETELTAQVHVVVVLEEGGIVTGRVQISFVHGLGIESDIEDYFALHEFLAKIVDLTYADLFCFSHTASDQDRAFLYAALHYHSRNVLNHMAHNSLIDLEDHVRPQPSIL